MALVLRVFERGPSTSDGTVYTARAWGARRDDGLWEGWIEFVADDLVTVLRSGRETTQSTLSALEYWASGLTPVYVEGALTRALARAERERRELGEAGESAPDVAVEEGKPARSSEPALEPLLDPFAVHAGGEALLERRLRALSPRHLRTVVRVYGFDEGIDQDLETLDEDALVALVTSAVRVRVRS